MGAAVARALKARGDHVVVSGRSATKTRSMANELRTPGHCADFASIDNVRRLAAELRDQHEGIDVLVNNAGLVVGPKRTLTADGYELTFQVNHLAPFLLTMLQRAQLTSANVVVVTTSSRAGAIRSARLDLDDMKMDHSYNALAAHRASKLTNVLFIRELARRWGPLGATAAAVHPGIVRSGWGTTGPAAVRLVVNSPSRLAMSSPERGAATIV